MSVNISLFKKIKVYKFLGCRLQNVSLASLLICGIQAIGAPVTGAVECDATKRDVAEQSVFNNREIADLYIADQQDRQGLRAGRITLDQMRYQDLERRRMVLGLHKRGMLKTADDLESAAMIFQHGDSAADFRLAFALATLAAAKSADPTETTWMMAATWDRLMLSLDRPQWYGTQFKRDASGKEVLEPIEVNAVNMAERQRLKIYLPEALR